MSDNGDLYHFFSGVHLVQMTRPLVTTLNVTFVHIMANSKYLQMITEGAGWIDRSAYPTGNPSSTNSRGEV